MKNKNIEVLLGIFTTALKENKFAKDSEKIMHICKILKNIQKQLPSLENLEEAKSIEVDLEIKYEDFSEIGNYFDPLYIEVKKQLHEEEIKKIRRANAEKRETK